MRPTLPLFVVSLVGFSAAPSFAGVPEGDVFLEIVNSRIATGLISEDGSEITRGVRLFAGTLGLDGPNFGADPGFMGLPGTFAVDTSVGFNVRAALRRWDGTDFSTIPPETFTIELGPLGPVETPPVDSLVPGFAIPVSSDPGSEGEWHHHPVQTLTGAASDGVYLVEFELFSTDPGLQTSLPFWFLWNQNESPATHLAAYAWAQENVVPTPAGFAALPLLGIAAMRRRR